MKKGKRKNERNNIKREKKFRGCRTLKE